MISVQMIEARVSRYYSRIDKPPSPSAQWADLVTVYTEFGSWRMPYDAFVALFGVRIAANTDGVMVSIPSHSHSGSEAKGGRNISGA